MSAALDVITDPTPGESCCWYYFWISNFGRPGVAPVPAIVQSALGGDGESLSRFFDPEDLAHDWSLPLHLSWGRASEWRVTAAWWRTARLRREAAAGRERFLTLDEINDGWDGGDEE